MKFETVIYESNFEIAIISFNRPEVLNAENRQLTSEFLQALKKAQQDTVVKAVIIRGEGRAFCSGHDLSEEVLSGTIVEEIVALENIQDITRTILTMGKPVIAAIHGYALGVGCEWAMNCDIRIAAEGTKFGFPETSVGATVTNAGTKILPLLIGLGRAKEMVFTNAIIDSERAEQWGLVNNVVPLEKLDEEAMAMAKKIAKNSMLATRLSKTALNQGLYQDFEQTLAREARDAVLVFSSEESAERARIALKKTKK